MGTVQIGKHKGKNITYTNNKFRIKFKGEWIEEETEEKAKETFNARTREDENATRERKKQTEEAKKEAVIQKSRENLLKATCIAKLDDLKALFRKSELYKDEIKLRFNNDRIEVIEMDSGNVLMFRASCKIENAKNMKNLIVCLSANNTHKLFNDLEGKKDCKVSVSFEKNSVNECIVFTNSFGVVALDLIDYEDRELKIPELVFNASFNLEASKFYNLLKICNHIGETILFVCQDNHVFLECKGDNGRYEIKLGLVNGKATPDVKSKYSLEYLRQSRNRRPFFNNSDSLTINFGDDYPLKIETEAGDWIILAPRIQND